MKYHPILRNDASVRAILAGTQTQARQPLVPQPDDDLLGCEWYNPTRIDQHGEESPGPTIYGCYTEEAGWASPFGGPGDRLWVRECWRPWYHMGGRHTQGREGVVYRADNHSRELPLPLGCWTIDRACKWRPSTNMPRWASRLTLLVKRVWVERLQVISAWDCIAEGFIYVHPPTAEVNPRFARFWRSWDSTHTKPGTRWADNPRVWATEFELIKGSDDG